MDKVEKIFQTIASLAPAERKRLFERLSEEFGGVGKAVREPRATFSPHLEGETDYVLIFDGGSHGNPGPGYGSYALIRKRDGPKRIVRLDFGDRQVTNNEAEYDTLIAGLEGLAGTIAEAGREVGEVTVEVRGDSKLVISQVNGTWKARDERMRARRNRVWELLGQFANCRLTLQPREESVKVLGH
ncbi:MAG: ribonuclease HI family protein [Chloroflexota bacterium]|nr:ribonuclease HI family protein [Chloroflexota bacterium]